MVKGLQAKHKIRQQQKGCSAKCSRITKLRLAELEVIYCMLPQVVILTNNSPKNSFLLLCQILHTTSVAFLFLDFESIIVLYTKCKNQS